VLLGSGLTVLSQPLMYVKVLVQVGYEPLPPTLGRNIFGRQVYQLPGLFAYAKHIVKVDGRAGLFKGLTPRLCSSAIGTVVHSKVLQVPGEWGTHGATHPRGGAVRGGLTPSAGPPRGTLSAFATIYREEGILGFFAGLVPRLLGDILSLWLCNMLAYLINTYALENGVRARGGSRGGWGCLLSPPQVSTMTEMKSYSQAVTGFFASMLTYPFVLVSNLMAVNNCGLAGGLLPYAPTYSSWLDCWSQLHREGNMSRGNSLFFRKVPTGKRYVWE
ncbi:MTCH2 protein, partial [Rostratula benghalensis]|nr:MTCH2 protein [Rostratula benghalensis]